MLRALALTVALLATGCSTAPAAIAQAPAAALAAQAKQPRGLHRFTSDANGFATHSFWYDTGAEVVVFDAQFTEALAEQLIAAIRAETASPITYMVVTHPNPDKFNGAAAFRKLGAKVVASEATARAIPAVHAYKKHYFVNVAKMFTEATYPAEARVDLTFRDRLSLPLKQGRVELRRLAHGGVATTQTVAHLPAAKALVVGDLVHHKAHAWLEGGLVKGQPAPDLASWKQALGELLAYRGATVYGGRGEAAPVEAAVKAQARYLDRLEALVKGYVRELGERRAELSGPQAGEHYKAIAARAQKAFPDYDLPFMIEYGVYGLVNALNRPER